ncbi:hypothetical protein GJ496_008830 [Pomphorhynchus laevis]|nr:hypothetical protein GJ496_008830 [Pomphorhynchus laevis]
MLNEGRHNLNTRIDGYITTGNVVVLMANI